MKEKVINRLVSVKSIVTILLTVMFAVLSFKGEVDQNFMVIYTAVITFYFSKADKSEPAEKDDQKKDIDPAELGEAVTQEVMARLNVSAPVAVAQGDRGDGEDSDHDRA
ncbi:hypothetical protein [uncultured Dysosmobacter sp.]|uniref:hypothetical protein n=1 Tax=uncultured Dysosmobacter sp. TaxID=2591384 RepID=UPI00260AF020|nr:hypothetical protein [uncultured Dysosmobacter sp.]